jgi:hypothetical protein
MIEIRDVSDFKIEEEVFNALMNPLPFLTSF